MKQATSDLNGTSASLSTPSARIHYLDREVLVGVPPKGMPMAQPGGWERG